MHRHLVTTEQLAQPTLELGRDEAHHLMRVLRVRDGDEIELFDGSGGRARGRVVNCGKHSLLLERQGEVVVAAPPRVRLTLFPCVSKGKRMEWTIEKASEMGVDCIQPVLSERSVVRLDSARESRDKRERWQKIAAEATRQSGGVWMPRVSVPKGFEDILTELQKVKVLLVAALDAEARPLLSVLEGLEEGEGEIGWIVGPEGDFTPEEVRRLREIGGRFCSLGENVLRTETAALYGIVALRMWLDAGA